MGAALAVLLACSSGGQAEDDRSAPGSPSRGGAGNGRASAGYGPPVLLGTLQDRSIGESSGLVASRLNPGSYWTHNDSGDGPYLYCVGDLGESCGVWSVTGAEARDWEDVAAGPGPTVGRSYLYVGDIGDNLDDQEHVTVYRVAEPETRADQARTTRFAPARTEPAEVLRLRYPDGPHNAETLLVHPQTGDLYVLTKEAAPSVFVARAPLTADATNQMSALAVLRVDGSERTDVVTGGDISPDGRRVALCTYGDGYELEAPPGESFDAVWRQPPSRFPLGSRVVGEAIAYRLDGRALLTTSEEPLGSPTPLLQVERR